MGRIRDCSLTLIAVAILASLCLVPAIALDPNPNTMDGTVLGSDSIGNIKLSFSTDDFMKNGYAYGDVVHVTTSDYEFDATLLSWFSGCFPYELGINAAPDSKNVTLFGFNMNLASIIPDFKPGERMIISYVDHPADECPHLRSGYLKEPMPSQSDDDFANFRRIDLGDFSIWRSSSPLYLYNGTLRSSICDACYGRDGISYAINVTDSPQQLSSKIEKQRGAHICDNYISLYDNGRIFAKYCENDFLSSPQSLLEPFRMILEHHDERICIHCLQGKERTGFVFMLMECIAGWSLDDMADDYTMAFANVYGIEKDSHEYEVVKKKFFDRTYYMMAHPEKGPFDSFFIDWDSVDIGSIDPYDSAKAFLLDRVGLTQEEFQQLEGLVRK